MMQTPNLFSLTSHFISSSNNIAALGVGDGWMEWNGYRNNQIILFIDSLLE
jgi:hypothetical protein